MKGCIVFRALISNASLSISCKLPGVGKRVVTRHTLWVVLVFKRYISMDISVHGYFIPLADNLNFKLSYAVDFPRRQTKGDIQRYLKGEKPFKHLTAWSSFSLRRELLYVSSYRTPTAHPFWKMLLVILPCSYYPCFLLTISFLLEKGKSEQASCTFSSDSLVSPTKAIILLLVQWISFQLYFHRRDCLYVFKKHKQQKTVKTACCDSKNSIFVVFSELQKSACLAVPSFSASVDMLLPKAVQRSLVVCN